LNDYLVAPTRAIYRTSDAAPDDEYIQVVEQVIDDSSQMMEIIVLPAVRSSLEGNVVKVTLATLDPIEAYVLYKWEDKEFLGEVSECVRQNNNYRMRVRMQEKIENEPDIFSTSLRRFYSRFWNG
jgi:hypothetical protein